MNIKKIYIIKIIFIFLLFFSNAKSSEQFQFDVTELEVIENGNIFKGLKRGTIYTNDGMVIQADEFVYNKLTNIVIAEGKVIFEDKVNKITISSDKATYKKKEEIIITDGNSKASDENNKIISAQKFTYNKNQNILTAQVKARVEDISENYIIKSDHITYFKNIEKIISKGKTTANIKSKYRIISNNIEYLVRKRIFASKEKTTLEDGNSQIYYFDEFIYLINEDLLKGKNILIVSNYNLPNSDKFYFSEGIFNLKNKEFIAKDTKINVHKNIFGKPNNEPRIYGVSSEGNDRYTKIYKGSFTACKKKDGCPPWTIQSELIEHDKNKKQISYKNAFLKLYDVPVLYFPKFFHPDPSVERQTGLLQPENNNSNVLGSSLTLPYYKVISENQDYTFSPTWFDNDILSFQNEYRRSNKNSNFMADLGFVKGYKSPTTKEKNSISHFFANYDLNLKLDKFDSSNLFISFEQVSNDTYLKVFNAHITKSELRPDNLDLLNNQVKLILNKENYNFSSGFHAYENLTINNSSDRYQYVLPYYNFDTILEKKYFNGHISINSSGSNNLKDTNNLKSNIINNINYTTDNYITNFGLSNNYNISIKNLNSLGKKNSNYKSSPQLEFVSLFEANSVLPLIKYNKNYTNFFTPKISLRINPHDMKDYSDSENKIDNSNIFALNRIGVNDTFEAGKSLTLGLEYKREKKNLEEINKFFEFNLATVIRDKEEKFIPKSSTINRKNSNIFGSVINNYSDYLNFGYNFAIDNDLRTFEYNDFSATLSVNNLVNTFKFVEQNGEMGDSNVFENSLSYKIDQNNLLTFKTRRNRKINLTEYYDLVYEYQNDCLTAGIKYKKSYYEDRDLKPNENLLFTITIFPITTYEYKADDLLESEF